ncbi:RidA family protein [Herbaspirillum sp. RV1423]|uniref:RidA family protein n=1 Tax=Herbaspirillum sp. RV1423 TaxID=1443993 RepID=UPI000556C558|nr:RidA family protein [Herbaspirillum sp. RV1423]
MSTSPLIPSSDFSKPVFLNPQGLYDPSGNGYSHLAIVETPARFIYVAGQGGENRNGTLPPDFAEQVQQGLLNLQLALSAAKADLGDVVKLTVLIVEHSQQRLEIFATALQTLLAGRPGPACTLIPVPRLALDGMLFEIDATAVIRR